MTIGKRVKVKDLFTNNDGPVELVSMNDKVDTLWGHDANTITLKQIEELKNGKVIYFDDGEYAHLIAVERTEE